MAMQTFVRCGAALLLVVFVSACSSTPSRVSSRGYDRSSECRLSRSSCLYEGAYEPGERDYAEQEAKRLNQAESVRVSRGFRR